MATRKPDETAPDGEIVNDPTAQVDVVSAGADAPAVADAPPPPAVAPPPPPAVPEPVPSTVVEPAVVEPAVVEPAVVEPAVVEAEPVAAESAVPPLPPVEPLYTDATPPQQVVYVHAPVPPRLGGNRGAGTLIAVLAAIVYGVVLAGATWILQYASSGRTDAAFLGTWDFYIPVAVFAIAFVLLVLIVNRAGWGAHVFGSLLVGAAVFFGTIGLDLLVNWLGWQVRGDFVAFLTSGFHILAAILAREVAVWFGAIIAARGRRVTERNAILRAEFDAKLAEFHAGNY